MVNGSKHDSPTKVVMQTNNPKFEETFRMYAPTPFILFFPLFCYLLSSSLPSLLSTPLLPPNFQITERLSIHMKSSTRREGRSWWRCGTGTVWPTMTLCTYSLSPSLSLSYSISFSFCPRPISSSSSTSFSN